MLSKSPKSREDSNIRGLAGEPDLMFPDFHHLNISIAIANKFLCVC